MPKKGEMCTHPESFRTFTSPATGELRQITSPHISEQLRCAAITVVYRFLTFRWGAARGRRAGMRGPEGRPCSSGQLPCAASAAPLYYAAQAPDAEGGRRARLQEPHLREEGPPGLRHHQPAGAAKRRRRRHV